MRQISLDDFMAQYGELCVRFNSYENYVFSYSDEYCYLRVDVCGDPETVGKYVVTIEEVQIKQLQTIISGWIYGKGEFTIDKKSKK